MSELPMVPWRGGECPVPGDELVDVRFRDGDILMRAEAGRLAWSLDHPLRIEAWRPSAGSRWVAWDAQTALKGPEAYESFRLRGPVPPFGPTRNPAWIANREGPYDVVAYLRRVASVADPGPEVTGSVALKREGYAIRAEDGEVEVEVSGGLVVIPVGKLTDFFFDLDRVRRALEQLVGRQP